MTDNTVHLLQAAAARHHEAVAKARAAIQQLDRDGQPITFQAVAAAAGVSRSWLYREPDTRALIERLRSVSAGGGRPVPASQRSTRESLREQLDAMRIEAGRLREENRALREELARRLGEQRASATCRQR